MECWKFDEAARAGSRRTCRIERLGGGGFPDIAQEEVVEAAFAVVAAKEAEAEEEVLDVPAVGPGGVSGLAVRAFR
jgi:hypothetical protein